MIAFGVVAAIIVLGDRLGSTETVEAILKTVATSLFAVGVVLALRKVKLGNPVLNWLGEISMELYLLQGMAIMLWRSNSMNIQNDLLYCILALVTTLALAASLHYGLKMIMKNPTR